MTTTKKNERNSSPFQFTINNNVAKTRSGKDLGVTKALKDAPNPEEATKPKFKVKKNMMLQ